MNNNVVSQYIGSNITLTCSNHSSNIIWLISPNGYDLYSIDGNNMPYKYSLDSQNTLTIINLDLDDNGYLACGIAYQMPNSQMFQFSSYSSYSLFIKRNLIIIK